MQILFYALNIIFRAQCVWILPFDTPVNVCLFITKCIQVLCACISLVGLVDNVEGGRRTMVLLSIHVVITIFLVSYEGDAWLRWTFEVTEEDMHVV